MEESESYHGLNTQFLSVFTSAICALMPSTVIGEPEYAFSATIGLILAILNYILNSNQ